MVITDVTGVIDAETFERPIYAGNAIQTVKSNDIKRFYLLELLALKPLVKLVQRQLKLFQQ